jgi:hypothetical protein
MDGLGQKCDGITGKAGFDIDGPRENGQKQVIIGVGSNVYGAQKMREWPTLGMVAMARLYQCLSLPEHIPEGSILENESEKAGSRLAYLKKKSKNAFKHMRSGQTPKMRGPQLFKARFLPGNR